MELLQMYYFMEVAKTGHMTKAAKNLHISQPAISKTIHEIETELGVPLFDRVGRMIVLNDYGKIMLKHTEEVFNSITAARNEISAASTINDKTVTIAARVASSHIGEIIRQFKQLHPDVSIKFVQMDLKNGFTEDIGLCSSSIRINKKTSHTLFKEDIALAVPVSHPFAKLDTINLIDVKGEPIIGLDSSQLNQTMKTACNKAGFDLNYAIESDDPSTVRKFIKMGLGLAFVPVITWHKISQLSDIRLIKIDNPACYRYVNLKWNPDTIKKPAVSAFRDFIEEYWAKLL